MIRTNTFHHCLVSVQAVTNNLETFDDLRQLCRKVSECDVGASQGHVSIAKAALALGISDAHLSAMLELVAFFAEDEAKVYLQALHQKVHVFGLCTMLFIQFLGRHLFDASSIDIWPTFQERHDAPVEQVELNKSTPSRSRPSASKSGSGPTKAHRLHLKHVIRQFRAVEKRLASLMMKNTPEFLELLAEMRIAMKISSEMIPCFSLLLEGPDGKQFPMETSPASASMTPAECSSVIQPHLQAAYAAAQGAYASSTSSVDDSSRELDIAVSDTSLDCESPRPPPGGAAQGRSWGSEDIIGACRTTVLRGESDVSGSSLAIVGCHEASIYVLAPLKHVLVSCCVDCTIVIGACGGSLRMEQCERMQIVSAAVRTTIATCRDSTMHIACNTQPLLSGDNRFIQLAPFNTAYEHLPRHLRSAGVARVPFHWSNPLSFSREPYKVKMRTGPADGGATGPVYLMPPEDFLPFMVPFKGGPGPLCGGACSETFQWSVDSDSESSRTCPTANPDVFALPPAYQSALQSKIQSVSRLRAAVKASFLDSSCKQEVQSVIQAYFKDWLKSSNNIRQVYDLARLERELARSHSRHKSRDRNGDSSRRRARERERISSGGGSSHSGGSHTGMSPLSTSDSAPI